MGPWYSGGGATWGIAAAAVGLRRIVPERTFVLSLIIVQSLRSPSPPFATSHEGKTPHFRPFPNARAGCRRLGSNRHNKKFIIHFRFQEKQKEGKRNKWQMHCKRRGVLSGASLTTHGGARACARVCAHMHTHTLTQGYFCRENGRGGEGGVHEIKYRIKYYMKIFLFTIIKETNHAVIFGHTS